MRVLFFQLVCLLISLFSLVPNAYCTRVRGLKIELENLTAQEEQGAAPAVHGSVYLHRILRDFRVAGSASEVNIELGDELAEASLVDTDEENEAARVSRGIKVHPGAKPIAGPKPVVDRKKVAKIAVKYNWSRSNAQLGRTTSSASRQVYKAESNYLKADYLKKSPKLRNHLAFDALQIVESDPHQRAIDSTTCLCVALRDKHEHVKKFVFHNGESALPKAMRQKAHELGYDVIQAEQSHAEGQLLQFLLRRNEARPGWYTHIMGMGCSRPHCVECDSLLRTFLGDNYYRFTTAAVLKERRVDNVKLTSGLDTTGATEESGESEEESDESEEIPAKLCKQMEVEASLVKGKRAVDTTEPQAVSNYYLSQSLKEALDWRLKRDLDLSGERFTKSRRRQGIPAD